MIKILKYGLLLSCCMIATACAATSQSGIREQFEKSHKDYNRMLRWNEVATAGMLYVEPEGREQFMKTAEDLKKRAVAITEYRVLTMECLAEKGTGEVLTEFNYYVMPSNRIKTLIDKQSWVYKETGGSKSWKIKTPLPLFE